MATNGAQSPLRRLKTHYENVEPTCPECGYIDTEMGWHGETDGRQVHYSHECPSCGAVQERTIDIEQG